jgi:hypothetical protein
LPDPPRFEAVKEKMINMLSFFLTKKDILLGYESLNLGMLKNPLYSLCLGEVAI